MRQFHGVEEVESGTVEFRLGQFRLGQFHGVEEVESETVEFRLGQFRLGQYWGLKRRSQGQLNSDLDSSDWDNSMGLKRYRDN